VPRKKKSRLCHAGNKVPGLKRHGFLPSHWPTWEEVEVAAVASLQGVPATLAMDVAKWTLGPCHEGNLEGCW